MSTNCPRLPNRSMSMLSRFYDKNLQALLTGKLQSILGSCKILAVLAWFVRVYFIHKDCNMTGKGEDSSNISEHPCNLVWLTHVKQSRNVTNSRVCVVIFFGGWGWQGGSNGKCPNRSLNMNVLAVDLAMRGDGKTLSLSPSLNVNTHRGLLRTRQAEQTS